MNILSVELTKEEAKSIIAQFIDQIDTFTICQLDTLTKGTEFEVSAEQVDFIAQVEFSPEYDDYEQPDCPTLISQSVSCKLKAYNKQGSEIQFKTENELRRNEHYGHMQSLTGIDIQTEIEDHFSK